uniref:HDC15690 n=1 Tax=Drosophila melanogaster TaxID=7227 RepID=Q6IJ84_DROME|nr:TPA_inf: HDC15690 [Drosophila melanogaster]
MRMRHEGAYEAVAYVIVGPMAQWMGMGVCVCVRCAYFTRPWETDLSCVSHTLDGWLDCDAIRWIAEMLLLLLLVDFKRVDCQPPMGGSGRTDPYKREYESPNDYQSPLLKGTSPGTSWPLLELQSQSQLESVLAWKSRYELESQPVSVLPIPQDGNAQRLSPTLAEGNRCYSRPLRRRLCGEP